MRIEQRETGKHVLFPDHSDEEGHRYRVADSFGTRSMHFVHSMLKGLGSALVLGPTGLAYDKGADVLYVASTADNKVFAVSHAGTASSFVVKGTPVFDNPHLRGPLALVFAPDGNLLTANGDAVNGDPTHPSEIIEFTKSGEFIREFNVDAGQGGAFGIATVLTPNPRFNFAAVDDVPNTISVYSLP